MLPDTYWKAEDQPGAQARTTGGNINDDDDQGDHNPSWMFKKESNREETKKIIPKKGDSKKPAHDNRARLDVKVQESTTEEKCVAGPILIRVQAKKKSDKIHMLNVKF